MHLDKKKPLLSDSLATGDNKGFGSTEVDHHKDRITRFGTLKHRAKKQEQYIWSLFTPGLNTEESNRASKHAQKLKDCANFLLFKNFYTIGDVRLSKLHTCGQHLICPFCAAIRASRAIQKYVERIDQVMHENRKLKPVLITLTVKNGSDLAERSEHLMNSFRTLVKRRQDYLKKGRGFNEFCKVQGAMYSYENTYNEKTNEWHPHIHMFALVDQWIDQQEFSEYWESITGDSMIVDVRRAKKEKGFGYSKAAAEVCKYALKFGDLSVQKTWEAFKILKGKRLTGAIGNLYGVKIPDTMTDDMPDDKTLPYLEMVYKFVYGKSSYYDLVATRHVEPQENDDAKELRRQGGSDSVAQAVGCGVAFYERTSSSGNRKKQHWQVPPVIRVRVRERIRRWDGYLCVLHL